MADRTGSPSAPLNVVHNAYTPKEAVEISSRAGAYKANMRVDKIIFSSFMAGALLSFAGACNIIVQASPWYQDNAPGVIKLFGALIFPFGLVIIVLTGADLATGSFLYTTLSTLHRRTSVWKMLMHWFLTFFGNLAGALFVVGILLGHAGVMDNKIVKAEAIAIATVKAVTPAWYQIFLRAIGANWLVCLACFLACMAREFFSKVVAIWWPVFCFVILGLDHVIANMLYIPIAIYLGHPKITVGYYIWKSMIPAFIGNVIGGGLFVGVIYWYLYMTGDGGPVTIDGENFKLLNGALTHEHDDGYQNSGWGWARRFTRGESVTPYGSSATPPAGAATGKSGVASGAKEAHDMV